MRVIGGAFRRRRLISPPVNSIIRPTSDRLRQTCFDFLEHSPCVRKELLHQAIVLDAFAGTGAWGLEALSRGARRAIFFDTSSEALSLVQQNVTLCHMGLRSCIEWVDATSPPQAHTPVDLVFLDPPYGRGLVAQALMALEQQGWFEESTLIIAEHEGDEAIIWPAFFERRATRTQGRSCLTLGGVKL